MSDETRPTADPSTNRRILFVTHACYLDDSNGAAIASRALVQALSRRGFALEVLCGAMLDINIEVDPFQWLAGRGYAVEEYGGDCSIIDASGFRPAAPPHFRVTAQGVPVTVHRSPTTRPHDPDDLERAEFLHLLNAAIDRFRPDLLVGYGGTLLALQTYAAARARGVATVFTLYNYSYFDARVFADIDAIVVPSRFSAEHYARTLGITCTVLPCLADPDRVRVARSDPRFVTFVNPSFEKGVYAFARIADELGRRRPDIPLLVVEGRGNETTLVGCGIDLRAHGTVHLIDHPSDPRRFWEVTRISLMPSLWWESQGLIAVEALFNGIPVIAADRGALPETLGEAGIVLPLPKRLTLFTRELPTPEEVAPWVEAIIRLWDDEAFYAEHSRRALAESRRWEPDVLEPRYVEFFQSVRPLARTTADNARVVARAGGRAIVVRPGKPPSLPRISYAQNMEDILLDRVFGDRTGTFLDVGANHPITSSNTYFFYERGWRGVNIEPNSALHRLLLRDRPEDLNLAVAVSDADGELPFYQVAGDDNLSTLSPEIAAAHRAQGYEVIERRIPIRTLASLIAEHAIEAPDFLSIDVENHEGQVLRGIPLAAWRPGVLVIESTLPLSNVSCHESWEPFVLGHGYLFAAFNGINRFYLRDDLAEKLDRLRWPVNVLDKYQRYETVLLRNRIAELERQLQLTREKLNDAGIKGVI